MAGTLIVPPVTLEALKEIAPGDWEDNGGGKSFTRRDVQPDGDSFWCVSKCCSSPDIWLVMFHASRSRGIEVMHTDWRVALTCAWEGRKTMLEAEATPMGTATSAPLRN